MIFTNRHPESRIYPQIIRVVAIFVAGGYLIDHLANDLD